MLVWVICLLVVCGCVYVFSFFPEAPFHGPPPVPSACTVIAVE